MTEKSNRHNHRGSRDIAEIEDAQAALRDSIEATKELAERAETLLQRHKSRVEQQQPGPRVS